MSTVGNRIPDERAPVICPRHSCNSCGKCTNYLLSHHVNEFSNMLFGHLPFPNLHSGNLDHFPLCVGDFNGIVPLRATPVLQLVKCFDGNKKSLTSLYDGWQEIIDSYYKIKSKKKKQLIRFFGW